MSLPSKVIGYWKESERENSTLPWPQGSEIPFEGKDEFVSRLKFVQGVLKPEQYKGSSKCRLCGELNGSKEYSAGGWRWPSGLMHYVVEHNVYPGDDFV